MSRPSKIHLSDVARLPSRTDAIADAIKVGQKILIVGTKAGNLPQWLRDHPLVIEWEAHGSEVNKATTLPEGTGVVLFLRWVAHRNHRRICAAAREAGIYAHPELLGTGEVRRTLNPLLPIEPAEPAAETSASLEPWAGSLISFVEQHYVFSTEYRHQTREVERLLRLAHQLGLTTTQSSMISMVSNAHTRLARVKEDARMATLPPVPDVPELLAKPLDRDKVAYFKAEPPSTVAALVETNATAEASVDTSMSELLRMIDDAVAVLGLAREQLVQLSAKNTTLRSSREALRDKVLKLLDEGI